MIKFWFSFNKNVFWRQALLLMAINQITENLEQNKCECKFYFIYWCDVNQDLSSFLFSSWANELYFKSISQMLDSIDPVYIFEKYTSCKLITFITVYYVFLYFRKDNYNEKWTWKKLKIMDAIYQISCCLKDVCLWSFFHLLR